MSRVYTFYFTLIVFNLTWIHDDDHSLAVNSY